MAIKKSIKPVNIELNCCSVDADLKLFLRKNHSTGEIDLVGKNRKGSAFFILGITVGGNLYRHDIPSSKKGILNLKDKKINILN